MPSSMLTDRQQRRDKILHLVQRHRVTSQAQLQQLLHEAGIEVNQATLSRDLRDLAVVKTHDGYQLPQDAAAAPVETLQSSLWHALNSWLRAATPAQNRPPGVSRAASPFSWGSKPSVAHARSHLNMLKPCAGPCSRIHEASFTSRVLRSIDP